jgi:hypothetical protein
MGAKMNNRAGLLVALCMLGGCSTIDTIEDRAETVNFSVAEYGNKSTLINILRAKDREPLSFLSITSVQGHNTLSGSAGIPTITFGPHPTTSRTYSFGPNSLSRSASNDFTMSVVDDPNTYASLFSPISPGTLALFLEQGYPREIMFNLFLESVTVTKDGDSAVYKNNINAVSYPGFRRLLLALLDAGLTIQNRNSVEGSQARENPSYRICFLRGEGDQVSQALSDTQLNTLLVGPLAFSPGRAKEGGARAESLRKNLEGLSHAANDYRTLACDKIPFGAAKASPKSTQELYVHLYLDDAAPANEKPDERKSPAPDDDGSMGFPLNLSDGTRIELAFRPAYGAYLYLGTLLGGYDEGKPCVVPVYTVSHVAESKAFQSRGCSADEDALLDNARAEQSDDQADARGLRPWSALFVAGPRPKGHTCFAEVPYGGKHWCIPDEEKNSKIVVSVLHQLVQLYSTPPSQSPTTLTTRSANGP